MRILLKQMKKQTKFKQPHNNINKQQDFMKEFERIRRTEES